jgi:chaperonin GroES
MDVKSLVNEVNIAEKLKEEQLTKIGKDAYEGYINDKKSRGDWEKNFDEWLKLALQVKEIKTFPWAKASNVKYPLLSIGAIQFSAKAYAALIPSDGLVVKGKVVGKDQTGDKMARADRIGKHMSFQLMEEMDEWEEEMDKLLIILPIVGTLFKKTYWDSTKKVNCSKLILPKDLVVNYWARSLDSAERITQILQMSKRLVKERQLGGIFLEDVELPKATNINKDTNNDRVGTNASQEDDTTPYNILEQHTYLDLDDDGYAEPYIVTFEEESHKVLRIAARFDEKKIYTNAKGELIKIEPLQYFTKFTFIPSPDGSIYDVGFGLLLGSINESANTVINQIIDGGTLYNLQSGFLAKGLRMKTGEVKFGPGEWKYVNSTGMDLKNSIIPLPTKEPSAVLMQLLEFLVLSGEKLSSVADINVGKMPGQNTPATTTTLAVSEGQRVFTSIYKRIYRSLTKEFKKIFYLNSVYLDTEQEVNILDEPIQKSDYTEEDFDVRPAADPNAVSAHQKLVKAQALVETMRLGTLDVMEVTMRVLDAQEQPNPEKLINKQPPKPDPEIVLKQEELKLKDKIETGKLMLKQQELKANEVLDNAQAILALAKAEAEKHGMKIEEFTKFIEMVQARKAALREDAQFIHDKFTDMADLAVQLKQQHVDQEIEKARAAKKAASND